MSIEGLPIGPRPDEISERSMRDFLAQAEEKLRERGLGLAEVQAFSKTFTEKFVAGYPAFIAQEGPKDLDKHIDATLKQTIAGSGEEVERAAIGLLQLRALKYLRQVDAMEEVSGETNVIPFPPRRVNEG